MRTLSVRTNFDGAIAKSHICLLCDVDEGRKNTLFEFKILKNKRERIYLSLCSFNQCFYLFSLLFGWISSLFNNSLIKTKPES